MRILIIQDDPNLRALWQAALQEAGHVVSLAPSPRAASRELMIRAFDLVFLDLPHDRAHGRDVLGLTGFRNPRCLVILVAGAGDRAAGELAAAYASVVTVLRKPVDIEQVEAVCLHLEAGMR